MNLKNVKGKGLGLFMKLFQRVPRGTEYNHEISVGIQLTTD